MGGMGYGQAAQLVGGLMQSVAAGQANKAVKREVKREIGRQQRYRSQAFGEVQESLPGRGVEAAREQLAEGSKKRQDFFNQVGQTSFGQGGMDNRSMQNYQLMGANRANLGAYNDWALNQMINNIRVQDELNKISNFSAGTASVFPARVQDAQHSWDELAFWGSLIGSIGGGSSSFLPSQGAPQMGSSTYALPNMQTYPMNQGFDSINTQSFANYA